MKYIEFKSCSLHIKLFFTLFPCIVISDYIFFILLHFNAHIFFQLMTGKGKKEGVRGQLQVMVKEARNLTGVKSNGFSDPFCKG